MANVFVDSNATGAANGTTWADAYTTIAAAAAADSAGDIIWVAEDHAESTASSVSWSWAGTEASPTRLICADSASGEPPSTVATTGSVTVTGNNNLTIAATGALYCYGLGS